VKIEMIVAVMMSQIGGTCENLSLGKKWKYLKMLSTLQLRENGK